MTPTQLRVNSVPAGGYVESENGVAALQALLADRNTATAFNDWKSQIISQRIAGAIRDLVMNQPIAASTSTDVAVQYGITQGLQLAYQLMCDPSLVLRGVFGTNHSPEPAAQRETFDTSIDDDIMNSN